MTWELFAITPHGSRLRVNHDLAQAEIETLYGGMWMPLEDFERFVEAWNKRHPVTVLDDIIGAIEDDVVKDLLWRAKETLGREGKGL